MRIAALTLAALCHLPAEAGQPSRGVHSIELDLMDVRGLTLRGFFVTMTPDGAVSRTGDPPLGPERVEADVRRALRDLLARERFFALRANYGQEPIEGRVRRIRVLLDGRSHSVAINDVGKPDTPSPEIARALRVWYGALRAVSDPGSIYTEADDRLFLDARR